MLKNVACIVGFVALSLLVSVANAENVNNGIPAGTLGSWDVEVDTGGETRDGVLWANRAVNGLGSDNVLFDYFSYVDIGSGGGTRLPFTTVDSAVASNGSGGAVSSGHFTGSGGNRIDWSVTSTIAPGSPTFVNSFTFTAVTGTLGSIKFYQYLDEDTFDVTDNVFFQRGSAATDDLELFTVHTTENVGISQGGSLSAATGLVNTAFLGFAVGEYNDMKPALSAGTQAVSLLGTYDPTLPNFLHPVFGPTKGPRDIVSVMAWVLNPNATSASFLTTLGGIPSPGDVPPEDPRVPEPAAILLGGMALAGFLGYVRRRRPAKS